MSTITKLPVQPGFRYLCAGERVNPTTDQINYNAAGNFEGIYDRPSWTSVGFFEFEEVSERDAEIGRFRRPAKDVPDFAPPAGYRWLKRGEVIESTDRVFYPHFAARAVGEASSDLGDDGAVFGAFARKLQPTHADLATCKGIEVTREAPKPENDIVPVRPPVDPGHGYRLLNENDTIRDGDDWWNSRRQVWENLGRHYSGVDVLFWGRNNNAIWRRARTYPELPHAETPVGAGYRMLAKGERLEEGDEYCARYGSSPRWARTRDVGQVYGEVNPGLTYRRKLPTQDVKPGEGYRLLVSGDAVAEGDEWQAAPIDPGAGYRLLSDDEKIQAGDDCAYAHYARHGGYWYPTISDNWGKTISQAFPLTGIIGGGVVIRRKVEEPKPAWKFGDPFDPPAGYRFLKVGEVVREGDQLFHPACGGIYSQHVIQGHTVTTGDLDWRFGQFTRKIEEPKPETPVSCPIPEGWRLLGPDEITQAGDVYVVREGFDIAVGSNLGKAVREILEADAGLYGWVSIARKIEVEKPAPRAPQGTPPAGYRFLVEGEIVQAGDRVFRSSGGLGELAEERAFGNAGWVGHRVGNHSGDFDASPFVRPVPVDPAPAKPVTQAIEPGEGYRLLAVGEIIQDGDEYLSGITNSWLVRAGSVGQALGETWRPTRRKVEPTIAAESTALLSDNRSVRVTRLSNGNRNVDIGGGEAPVKFGLSESAALALEAALRATR